VTTTTDATTATPAARSDENARPKPSELKPDLPSRILGPIEEMNWLEGVGEKLSTAIEPLTRRRGLMDVLHGRWLGHSLHAALSDLPIGFWTGACVLELAGEERAAGVLAGAGCAAALATAATGTADWSVTDGRERRLGLAHGMANSVALALELGGLVARALGRPRTARSLSFAGVGVGAVAAAVGGELVFGRGLMVDHTAWLAGPQEWTAVLRDADLSVGETRAVEVEGRRLLLHRTSSAVVAMEDACSHAGGPLSEGEVQGDVVVCPWHGSRFCLRDGRVLGGPATHAQLRLEVRVRAGSIEVRGREG
jgi:nitrite reductase/ring-hydroxylating ferredoxin subunit